MKVTFFGTRGSCPCAGEDYQRYGGNTSCVLITIPESDPLILDLGTGLRGLGTWLAPQLKAEGKPLRASALLTHLHYDHLLGLPFFSPLQDPGAVLNIYGPTQSDGPLSEVVPRAVQPPFFPLQLKEFRGEVRLHEAETADIVGDGYRAIARRVDHPGATVGYRVSSGDSVLAYIPDHQAPLDRQLVPDAVHELCDGADVLIHDAQYLPEDFKPAWGHSTVQAAIDVAARAGVRRLVLTHHDPDRTDDALDAIGRLACALVDERRLALEVLVAREGLELQIG
ncbi:MAG: MBL fold metallo-hydrolase [Actinomycetes bacterium]